MKHNYTKANLEKTLKNIEDLLNLGEKQKKNMIELQKQLIRIKRAINKKFWLEDWKTIPQSNKIEIIKNEKCIVFNSYNMQEKLRDFPFIARVQWEKDRKKLIKEGEIIE